MNVFYFLCCTNDKKKCFFNLQAPQMKNKNKKQQQQPPHKLFALHLDKKSCCLWKMLVIESDEGKKKCETAATTVFDKCFTTKTGNDPIASEQLQSNDIVKWKGGFIRYEAYYIHI